MDYYIALHTDVGIQKETNQDSMCIKQARTDKGIIVLAMVCDGMGGLEKGEVASATIIKAFSKWFEQELPIQLAMTDYEAEVRYRWERLIKEQNQIISEYGRNKHIQLGSTITAMLIYEDGNFLIGHVGDTRAYKITEENLEILTTDQTVVAKEVRQGRLTQEQAESDPRRNVLLQCIGASRVVEPDFVYGKVKSNECYMLCSDGFRHVVTPQEIKDAFIPSNNAEETVMKENIVRLVDMNKERGETDNISAILIKIL